MSSRRILAGVVLAFVAVAPALAAKNTTPPFVFAQSVLAPAPSRGWVVLLPGEGELRFGAVEAHYQQSARRLNANGFDTLIVPYEDAYDEDLDGDTDSDGERVAAVTLRAVHWMQSAHGETEDKPGAVIAWGEGAQGLWALAQIGSKYPLANLVAGVAFYPLADDQAPFNSRLPMLVQAGSEDASA